MLNELIKSAGLTKIAVCEKVGISAPTLERWDKDLSTVKVEKIARLAKILPATERARLLEELDIFLARDIK